MPTAQPPFDDEPPATGAPVSPQQKRAGEGGPGRPPFKPTELQRKQVAMMAAAGIPQDDMRLVIVNPATGKPIDRKTLDLHFERELEESATKANAKVAQSLFRKATGDGPQSVAAAIFWAKCRMGWKERVVAEVEVKSGVLVAPVTLTPEQWIAAQAAQNAQKTEPGAGSGGDAG